MKKNKINKKENFKNKRLKELLNKEPLAFKVDSHKKGKIKRIFVYGLYARNFTFLFEELMREKAKVRVQTYVNVKNPINAQYTITCECTCDDEEFDSIFQASVETTMAYAQLNIERDLESSPYEE